MASKSIDVRVMAGRTEARDFDAGTATTAAQARKIVVAKGWPVISVRETARSFVVRVEGRKKGEREHPADTALRALFGRW